MSTLLRLTALLMLLSFFFVAACNTAKNSEPASEASPAAKVKKVKVGSKTMTLEEEEEEDVEVSPTAQGPNK